MVWLSDMGSSRLAQSDREMSWTVEKHYRLSGERVGDEYRDLDCAVCQRCSYVSFKVI